MPITKASGNSVTAAAKGDLVVGNATNDSGVLSVGANNTVLTADSATATGLKWAAPAGGGASWSLLNTGGTNLTGAQTITVSGISGADKILVLFQSASTGSTYAEIGLRLNADTGATNYQLTGARINAKSGYNENIFGFENENTSRFVLAKNTDNAGSNSSGYMFITGANSSGLKAVQTASGVSNAGGGSDSSAYHRAGVYLGTSAITSISMVTFNTNFDGGQVFVYTSA